MKVIGACGHAQQTTALQAELAWGAITQWSETAAAASRDTDPRDPDGDGDIDYPMRSGHAGLWAPP
jgi:hypothetical protein